MKIFDFKFAFVGLIVWLGVIIIAFWGIWFVEGDIVLSKELIKLFGIYMSVVSFLTAGVFYYVSVNGYLSSNLLCGNNTILNRCEAITCGSYNITLPNIEIPSCPDCNEVNVYCNNS